MGGLGFPIMFYGPDWLNTFKFWRRREALMVLEKRLAAGKNPIDHDFAPAELIESMVPAAGQMGGRLVSKSSSCEKSMGAIIRKKNYVRLIFLCITSRLHFNVCYVNLNNHIFLL